MREERKDTFMDKKWPAYIAIVIICIPLFVVLGYARDLSVTLWEAVMSVLTLITPVILAWIIGYMDGSENSSKDSSAKKAMINAVIAGVLCGVSLIFGDTVCLVVTIILAVVIAVKVKGFVSEYKEMKEMLSASSEDESKAE